MTTTSPRYVETPQSICRFGIATCDITPPVGIYHRMWGAATHERATGVHRPLTAAAMVFQPADGTGGSAGDQPASHAAAQSDTEQVVIALDQCILWDGEMQALLAAISAGSGVPRARLLVVFSHTHSSGLMDLERQNRPGGELIAPYLQTLAERIARIVIEARQKVQPVTITYGAGHCSLAAQRDFWDEVTQQFVCGFNPQGVVDDTVLVARVTDAAGGTVATLVNYACHPTTLAWQNTLISPDYPGAMREVVERATGAPCVFLQGASGDVGPREGYVGDVAVADRNGRQLGYAALEALESLPPPRTRFEYTGPVISGATLGGWAHAPLDGAALAAKARWDLSRFTVDLPYRPELPTLEETLAARAQWEADEQAAERRGDSARARDCHAMVERMNRQLVRIRVLPAGSNFPLPVTLWQMGDALWLAVEAEHYNLLQRELRGRVAGQPLVLMTIANGTRAAYLPAADAYGKGIYQESIACLAAGSLEQLIDVLAERLQQFP